MTATEAIRLLWKLSVRVTRGPNQALRLPIDGIGQDGLGKPLLMAHDDKVTDTLGGSGWIYHTEVCHGNFYAAVELINAHHPEWDVVTMSFESGVNCTMIVHRTERGEK